MFSKQLFYLDCWSTTYIGTRQVQKHHPHNLAPNWSESRKGDLENEFCVEYCVAGRSRQALYVDDVGTVGGDGVAGGVPLGDVHTLPHPRTPGGLNTKIQTFYRGRFKQGWH